jgi:hypothetical protein
MGLVANLDDLVKRMQAEGMDTTEVEDVVAALARKKVQQAVKTKILDGMYLHFSLIYLHSFRQSR